MRVTGGLLGGRVLRAPAGTNTRPTADRVRQALFNILGPRCEGAQVLDLYAGSGALGIEALSRGAAHAVFVESDRRACQVLEKNLLELALPARAAVLCQPVPAAFSRLRGAFELIFADPPYASADLPELLAALGRPGCALLAARALVVVEHGTARRDPVPPERAGDLVCSDRRRYGQTGLAFYVSATVGPP